MHKISRIAVFVFCLTALNHNLVLVREADCAQEAWKNDFNDICSGTQDAAFLTTDELKQFVSRCDTLKAHLEKLEEPDRKINLKRLQMCRDLYIFLIQARESP